MSKPMAIQATFSDFKLVKGRKVAQLVFEISLEQADDAIQTLGGLPQPSAERWFAIARLVEASAKEPPANDQPYKDRKKFETLPLPQQSALLCGNESFRRFLHEEHGYPVGDAKEAAEAVREICAVASRSEFTNDPKAAGRWVGLNTEYDLWMRCAI